MLFREDEFVLFFEVNNKQIVNAVDVYHCPDGSILIFCGRKDGSIVAYNAESTEPQFVFTEHTLNGDNYPIVDLIISLTFSLCFEGQSSTCSDDQRLVGHTRCCLQSQRFDIWSTSEGSIINSSYLQRI